MRSVLGSALEWNRKRALISWHLLIPSSLQCDWVRFMAEDSSRLNDVSIQSETSTLICDIVLGIRAQGSDIEFRPEMVLSRRSLENRSQTQLLNKVSISRYRCGLRGNHIGSLTKGLCLSRC